MSCITFSSVGIYTGFGTEEKRVHMHSWDDCSVELTSSACLVGRRNNRKEEQY